MKVFAVIESERDINSNLLNKTVTLTLEILITLFDYEFRLVSNNIAIAHFVYGFNLSSYCILLISSVNSIFSVHMSNEKIEQIVTRRVCSSFQPKILWHYFKVFTLIYKIKISLVSTILIFYS